MKINSISYNCNNQYSKQNTTFKGQVLNPTFRPEVSIVKAGEMSFPRAFSYSKYSLIMAHPDFLTKNANSTIAYQILKDVRKSQSESEAYLPMAERFQRFFAQETSKYPDGNYNDYETERYENGLPIKEYIDYGYTNEDGKPVTYGVEYMRDGSIFCVAKLVDKIPTTVTYCKPFKEYGKVNYINFNKNGTIDEIGIGSKHSNDGTITIDKLFKYKGKNKLYEGGLDVIRRKDGSEEIRNYYRLNPTSDEYIDKYAGKKCTDKDGNVTYEGLIYFNQKHFYKYLPAVYFDKGDDNNKLIDKMIKSGEFAV